MEVLLTESFFFCFYRLIPIVLAVTGITGILSFCYMSVLDVDNEDVTGFSLINIGGRTLTSIFRESLFYLIILVFVALVLYSIIFAWSINAREEPPSEKEFIESLYCRDQVADPITSKTNLIGASHNEIEMIFGKADRKTDIGEQHKGITELGAEYIIKVVFLPVVDRVVWYESALFVG